MLLSFQTFVFFISEQIVTEDQLEEVALHSNIFDASDDYLERNLRDQFEAVVPDPQTILPQNCMQMYLTLKQNIL